VAGHALDGEEVSTNRMGTSMAVDLLAALVSVGMAASSQAVLGARLRLAVQAIVKRAESAAGDNRATPPLPLEATHETRRRPGPERLPRRPRVGAIGRRGRRAGRLLVDLGRG